jgi:hypothetical protein
MDGDGVLFTSKTSFIHYKNISIHLSFNIENTKFSILKCKMPSFVFLLTSLMLIVMIVPSVVLGDFEGIRDERGSTNLEFFNLQAGAPSGSTTPRHLIKCSLVPLNLGQHINVVCLAKI